MSGTTAGDKGTRVTHGRPDAARHVTTIALLLGVLVLVTAAYLIGARSGADFAGSDGQATAAIEEGHPSYDTWFTPLSEPSGEVESGLFALQAALGGAAVGYCVAALRGRRRLEELRRAFGATPPAGPAPGPS